MSLRSSRFQSSPALWGRCNLFGVVHDTTPIPVSILTGPLGPVQRHVRLHLGILVQVSILTGPLGPVQPGRWEERDAPMREVSILTGPLGPVQRQEQAGQLWEPKGFNPHRPFGAGATALSPLNLAGAEGFQSSPALWGRCNPQVEPVGVAGAEFQSSPALWGRCNCSTQDGASEGNQCFNPHRPFGAGATMAAGSGWRGQGFNPHRPFGAGATACTLSVMRGLSVFQSSPALWGRCNEFLYPGPGRVGVSILTGPLGPVQRFWP